MLSDLRAVFGWIDTRLKLRWLLLGPVMTVAAALEAVSAVAVFGLLRLIVEPFRVRTAPLVSNLWRAWPSDDIPGILALLTVLVAALYVVRGVFLVWAEWLKETSVNLSAARAAERLFSRYLAADYTFHRQRRSASLIQRISRSTDVAFQLFAASVVNVLAEVLAIAALLIVLLFSAPLQALGAAALVLVVVGLPLVALRRVWVRSGTRQGALEGEQLHVLQQSLGAIKEVKIGAREAFFEGRLRGVRRALARVRQRRALVATGLRLGIETTLVLCMLGVVLLLTMQGATGAQAVSYLGLFAYAGFRVVPSANRIMLNAGYIREARAFVSEAVADYAALRPAPEKPHATFAEVEFRDALVLRDVSFAYSPDSPPALTRVNVRINHGESVGLVGPTGAGKSTLVDVILGLLRPTSGRVLLDGDDLAGRERGWQRLIGYVPQAPFLLDDTLRRNIAFGVPEALIDDHRVARACTLAQLDDVVRQLPLGLDTDVGEDGARLSGGQRQRVAIARALYAEPEVLVFDEATAALDQQTEREVTAAIASLHGTRTLIVIAHRLSTVQSCDRLIFLQDGRVAVTGTYNELLRDPSFRSMTGA